MNAIPAKTRVVVADGFAGLDAATEFERVRKGLKLLSPPVKSESVETKESNAYAIR